MDYSYIGSGKIYLREVGASAGLVEVGNCSALNFAVQEEVKEQRDYTSTGGGVLNEVRRITGVEVSISLAELSPANLARALYGTTTAVVAGTVTTEAVTAYEGALSRLAHVNPSAVVVQDVTDTTTYVAGTDYEVRPGGIYVIAGGAITDADVLHVDYSYGAEDVVQALASSAKEYEVVFEGLNEARSGKAVLVDAWRVKFGAAQNLSLIGDDFASLELTGKVLKDSTKIGGISQFFKTTSVQ
jgi:hypothetical protein